MTTTRGTRASADQRTVRTTTLEIQRPQDFGPLERRFRIERYVLPDDLLYSKGDAETTFQRVHAALREHLDVPYKSFRHDRLDGRRRWAVYALFPRDCEAPSIFLPWHREHSDLPHRVVSSTEMPFHVLVKLLQISLFRGEVSTRFVGQDSCYAYACPDGGDFHACVCVELKGERDANDTDPVQAFRAVPQTRRFGPTDMALARQWEPFYAKRYVGQRFYFLQLRRDQAAGEQTVYHEVKIPNRRVHTMYHDARDLDASRGKILNDFIYEFIDYLQEVGITAAPRQRQLTRFKVASRGGLDLAHLGEVGVLDNRLRRDTHPLASYLDLFSRLRPNISFVPVERPEDAPGGGILALLDASADDFTNGGILAGWEDPYQRLYRSLPQMPKQSLMVNGNDKDALAGREYLDYAFPGRADEKALTLRLETSLQELYLKCAIVHGYQRFPLPRLTPEHAYVRRQTRNGQSYTTALWFDAGHMRFVDLGDPEMRPTFIKHAAHWGVDYDGRFEEFLASLRWDKEPAAYDLILGPDLFVAIEDLEERVVYDYPEIVRRHRERARLRPIEDFKLTTYADALKVDDVTPLRAFDEILDEIGQTHPMISYEDLAYGARREDLVRALRGTRGVGKPTGRILSAKYRALGLILSERGSDVQTSQGIWYDAGGAFVVGGSVPMHADGQENAHLIRRFRVFQGSDHFDREGCLATMAIPFVRLRQYTVLPYPFHLIDLHVTAFRRFEG